MVSVFLRNELKELIHATVGSIYEQADPSHRWDHVVAVMQLAVSINLKEQVWDNESDVIVAALLHDIGCANVGKGIHHIEGARMLSSGELMEWFDDIVVRFSLDKYAILYSIIEHRASYQGSYSTKLSELISAADRLEPSVERVVLRMKQWGASLEKTVSHLQDKFSTTGYAVYPECYKSYFGTDFISFQEDCGKPDIIKSFYDK